MWSEEKGVILPHLGKGQGGVFRNPNEVSKDINFS